MFETYIHDIWNGDLADLRNDVMWKCVHQVYIWLDGIKCWIVLACLGSTVSLSVVEFKTFTVFGLRFSAFCHQDLFVHMKLLFVWVFLSIWVFVHPSFFVHLTLLLSFFCLFDLFVYCSCGNIHLTWIHIKVKSYTYKILLQNLIQMMV